MPRRQAWVRIGVTVALLFAVLGGWLAGASARGELNRALRAAELRSDLLETRAALLGARVSLCDADFDGMSQQLEMARIFAGRADAGLGSAILGSKPPRVNLAGFSADIEEAQRLVARVTPIRR